MQKLVRSEVVDVQQSGNLRMVIAQAVGFGLADDLCLFCFVDLQTQVFRRDQSFLARLPQALLERFVLPRQLQGLLQQT